LKLQTEDGARLSTNTETSGRYHTDWLNMIYPRLKLAKTYERRWGYFSYPLMNRSLNLKNLMNVFGGEEKPLANIVWQKKYSPQNDANILVICMIIF
jgi:adenine-specific DNA-methyltransferase